ncbi:hypothetical protein Tco_1568243 [Tanacetum coccineum]
MGILYKSMEVNNKLGSNNLVLVSNDNTTVAQRWLEDKQPEEKTNTDCLVKEQEKEYQTGWKIKTGNVLNSCNQRSTQQCTKSGVAKHLGAEIVWSVRGSLGRGYNHIYISSEQGTGSMQVLQGVEFEVELQEDHTFEVELYRNFNHVAGSQEDEIWVTKGLLVKAKGNILGVEIIRDQSSNTLRVSQSRFYNEKLVQTLLKGHSILSLEGSLSGDCYLEKNGMLDKFDCGLQTNVQVFVDFDYTMGRSITVMAGYMTLTEAVKEAIGLKGLTIESGFELKIVAGIATGALSKAIPSSRFQHRLKLLRIEDF